jgi:lipid-A-disaccharide synthase
MLVAGEVSGDLLAAELVQALRGAATKVLADPGQHAQPLRTSLAPRLFGAGGPRMAEAGVELAFDMTRHAVVGLTEVVKRYGVFRQLFGRLLRLAVQRQPEAIVCVDFSGFNRRLARAIKHHARAHRGLFHNWAPRIVQYVSPQVWASRPGRARQLERDCDLLLSIFPFEKEWYARRAPGLRVEFVGHPVVERHACVPRRAAATIQNDPPVVVLLPGSRLGEIQRHLPVLREAVGLLQRDRPVRVRVILPNEGLAQAAAGIAPHPSDWQVHCGGLADLLANADLALASTGTITVECAWFGVPTIALYKTSWSTYQIARRLASVRFLAMPNILAGEAVMPEFIQDEATPANLAREAVSLLTDASRRAAIHAGLARVADALGGPGASRRAAEAILRLLD